MKRMNTLLSVAIAAMMISGAFMVLGPTVTAKAPTTIADPDPIDMGYMIRDKNFDPALLSQNGHTAAEAVPGDYWVVGNVAKYYVGSYGSAYYTLGTSYMWFTMRESGENCELWTADDMSFPEGDPRNAFTSRLTITDEQAQYMVDQFDDNIYPTESQYFSTPPQIDGTESYFESLGFPESRLFKTHDPGKVMIMVFNIVDDSYWDPDYPYYIVGFFSPSTDFYYDRNIIHIDVYDWANRTGPDTPDHRRDFLYESTVAHEYQHLLHNYLDPSEDTWVNEGCSDYAEMLCGYGVPSGHIASYLECPSNSLTVWGDQGDINILADYGAAALFMIYMNDHFGGASFISALVQSPEVGTMGVTEVLHELGYWYWSFPAAFKAFALANLIRADSPGNGLYNYVSVDLDEIQALTVNDISANDGFVLRSEFLGPTITPEGYDTGVATLDAYSLDYYTVSDFGAMDASTKKFIFDGADEVVRDVPWEIIDVEGTDYWYSGSGIDLADFMLAAPLSVSEGSIFEFDTAWSLEEFWDYGMVQVSTDGGFSWTSLEYEYTTYEYDPSAHPDIIANLPGVTGESDGVVHAALDLSDYAGMDILLSFRYMTDWGTTEDGWWVGGFMFDGEAVDLNTFEPVPIIEPVDFKVWLYCPATDSMPARIVDLMVYHNVETAMKYLSAFNAYEEMYILISPNNGPVDYGLGIVSVG